MFKRLIASLVCFTFIFSNLQYVHAQPVSSGGGAFSINQLPAPGTIVGLSEPFTPSLMKGLKIHPENPFLLDFIMDAGKNNLSSQELKSESEKMVKYFLAALTVPEKDMWVNLSPYEKDKILPDSFSLTELGRDLLGEDYILKQTAASALYPEKELGRDFWSRVYKLAQQKYGTTDIPITTLNKVWIVADKVSIYEKNQSVYIVDSRLKVMLEEDYLAKQKSEIAGLRSSVQLSGKQEPASSEITNQILRELVLPEIEKEVNTGKNFALLRQAYNSVILATWFKRALKDAVLNEVYADKNKVAGIDLASPKAKEEIYQRYLRAYRKGAFNYVKEEINALTNEPLPRKYFSGGMQPVPQKMDEVGELQARQAMAGKNDFDVLVNLDRFDKAMQSDKAMLLLQDKVPSNIRNVLEETNADIVFGGDYPTDIENIDDTLGYSPYRQIHSLLQIVDKDADVLLFPTNAGGNLKLSESEMLKIGNLEETYSNHFKVVNDKKHAKKLSKGFAISKTTSTVYITKEYLKKIQNSNDGLNYFFAGMFLALIADGKDDFLPQDRANELWYKYALSKSRGKIKELFASDADPETLINEFSANLLLNEKPTTPKEREEQYQQEVFLLANRNNEIRSLDLKIPAPDGNHIKVVKETLKIIRSAAYLMARNAMSGIVNYKTQVTFDSKRGSITVPSGVTTFEFAPSKFGPPTVAHDLVMMLLPSVLMGVPVAIVNVSKNDPTRKPFVQKTFKARWNICEAELKKLFGDLVSLLPIDFDFNKGLIGITNKLSLNDGGGEENLATILDMLPQMESAVYVAGSDHRYVWRPFDANKDSIKILNFCVVPADKHNLLRKTLLFYPELSFEIYKKLIGMQQHEVEHNNGEGVRKFYVDINDHTLKADKMREEAKKRKAPQLDMDYRHAVIDTIRNAAKFGDMEAKLKKLIGLGKYQGFPLILPELDVPGKLYIIQSYFNDTQHRSLRIKFAHTYREAGFFGDALTDRLITEGKLDAVNIKGYEEPVAATETREAIQSFFYGYLPIGKFSTVTKEVLRTLFNKKEIASSLARYNEIVLPVDGSYLYLQNWKKASESVTTQLQAIISREIGANYQVGVTMTRPEWNDAKTNGELQVEIKQEGLPFSFLVKSTVINTFGNSNDKPEDKIKILFEIKPKEGFDISQKYAFDFKKNMNVVTKAITDFNAKAGVTAVLEVDKAMVGEISSWDTLSNQALKDAFFSNKKKQLSGVADTETPGGIDLNADNAVWQTRKENGGVSLRVDPALIAQIRRQGVPGLSPVVISITPVQNLAEVFGLN